MFSNNPWPITLIIVTLLSAGYLMYIIDVAKGRTSPAKATWITWSLLDIAALLAAQASGAGPAIALLYVHTGWTIITMVFALIKGSGSFTKTDYLSFLIATIGGVVWKVRGSSDEGSLAMIIALFCGGLPLWGVAWRNPKKASPEAWILFAIGNACGLLLVPPAKLTIATYGAWIFPVYAGTICALYTAFIYYARYRKKNRRRR